MKFLNARSPLCLLFLSLLTFFLLDNLIFRSGFYAYYLSDNHGSTALLKVKYVLDHERKDKYNILIPSASLLRADLRLLDFKKKNLNAPFTLLPLALSGTGAYTQYYLLREIDPTHQKYHTIILPMESYKILSDFDPRDDTQYQETRRLLTFTKRQEWPELLEPYKGTAHYNQLMSICFLMHRAYRDDLETLIPSRRIAQNFRTEEENYLQFYEGSSTIKSFSGLKVNNKNEIIACPFSDLRHGMQKLCDDTQNRSPIDLDQVRKKKEQKAQKVLAYQTKWLGKILDLYKDSPTQIIFIQMPHIFFYEDRVPLPNAPDLRDILPKNKNVHFLDEHYFDFLNQNKYMRDDEHLNKQGSEIFTEMLTPLLYKFASNEALPRMIRKQSSFNLK